MKNKKKVGCWCVGAFLVVLMSITGFLFIKFPYEMLELVTKFDAEGRYDSTELNYMGVIFENKTDIVSFNEGYSESNDSAWGFEHNGIDYAFLNNSEVIAASPGRVVNIETKDYGEDVENRFHVRIWVRFNDTVQIGYNFEPWTNTSADLSQQISMFTVEEGDWVSKGQEIARFLAVGSGAHIHFDVIEKANLFASNKRYCPRKYFGETDYLILMDMIHEYHPTWDLCYP